MLVLSMISKGIILPIETVFTTGGGLLSLVKNDLVFRIHDPSPQGEMEVGTVHDFIGYNIARWDSLHNQWWDTVTCEK